MPRDVRVGLSTMLEDLPPRPKYLYDQEGSRIPEEAACQDLITLPLFSRQSLERIFSEVHCCLRGRKSS